MDDNVKHFLDMSLPHSKLESLPDNVLDFKTQEVDASLRTEAQAILSELNNTEGADVEMEGAEPSVAEGDAMVEMSTIMEGFRYLINDNQLYPVLKDRKVCPEFPIIPIGMLQIWRE